MSQVGTVQALIYVLIKVLVLVVPDLSAGEAVDSEEAQIGVVEIIEFVLAEILQKFQNALSVGVAGEGVLQMPLDHVQQQDDVFLLGVLQVEVVDYFGVGAWVRDDFFQVFDLRGAVVNVEFDSRCIEVVKVPQEVREPFFESWSEFSEHFLFFLNFGEDKEGFNFNKISNKSLVAISHFFELF